MLRNPRGLAVLVQLLILAAFVVVAGGGIYAIKRAVNPAPPVTDSIDGGVVYNPTTPQGQTTPTAGTPPTASATPAGSSASNSTSAGVGVGATLHGTYTMAQLQALNRDLICSGTATVNGVTTSFTNHIAADRGSGVSMRATGTVSGHNINTLMTGVTQTHTDAMYIWEEGQLGGMATLNFTNTAQGQAQASARAANVTYDVTCTPWTPDMSMFVPPSNIKFITTSGGSAAGASTGAGGYPAPAQTNPTSTTVGEGTDLISASNQLTALSKNLGCTIQANNSNFTSVVAILYYHPSAADVKAHIANPYATENPNMYYVQQGPPTSEETVANYYSISMVCRK